MTKAGLENPCLLSPSARSTALEAQGLVDHWIPLHARTGFDVPSAMAHARHASIVSTW